MKFQELKIEAEILNSWKLRIGLLCAILSPAAAAMGAYYNLRTDMTQAVEHAKEQVDEKYVRKEAFEALKDDVRDVKNGVNRIEDILIRRPR